MDDKYNDVTRPEHYVGNTSMECIDVMKLVFGERVVMHFCLCNAFKYMWRCKHKNGIQDLQKANWYCDTAEVLTSSLCFVNDRAMYNKKIDELRCMLSKLTMEVESGKTTK